MKITLYNTLSHKKQIFKSIRKDWVGFYTCGPTVYNYAHIGNLRTYIFEDVLKRTLEYAGYKVKHIMNITDIEDKIIKNALEQKKNIYEFTAPYEKAFFKDLGKLNIKKAWKYPKATEHIKEMIKIIEKLLKKEAAYIMDGSVYFNISKFKNYGHLSRIQKKELKTGVRVNADEYAKDSAEDFVLWKNKKPEEPSWKAPFGEGRPGWHIECSAMSIKYLGETFDIHAGAVDLIFPHHENEIAQSEGASEKTFSNFFIHGEHLLVNREKMSKSLGNIYTLRDFELKNINPLSFRYLILTSHYRSKLNFTWESLESAEKALERIQNFIKELLSKKQSKEKQQIAKLKKYKSEFDKAVFNDLDTPKALAVIWKLINEYNKNPKKFNPKEILNLFYKFDKILGINLKKIKIETIPKEITLLIKQRENFRKNKDWQKSDEIREKIKQMGWAVEDTEEGTKITKI